VGAGYSPAVMGGAVYVSGDDGTVYALDAATGGLRWVYTIGSFADSTPAVAGSAVYIGSDDGTVYALDTGS
jgi:eukaryotic-like serine/threonine-protein kinase